MRLDVSQFFFFFFFSRTKCVRYCFILFEIFNTLENKLTEDLSGKIEIETKAGRSFLAKAADAIFIPLSE